MNQPRDCRVLPMPARARLRRRVRLNPAAKITLLLALALLCLLAADSRPAWAAEPGPDAPRPTPDAAAPASAAGFTTLAAAPGYCPSAGGDTNYERITNVILTDNNDGTMKMQVDVFIANPQGCVAGEECPSYDPSPENVNAWIDWNGDKVWDASEQVLDKALTGYLAINYGGTMTGIAQFPIPAGITETTWLRANLGWSVDPNDACTPSWAWGNVVDQAVALKVPKVKEVKVEGSKDPKNPMTTYDVKLQAVVETPPGMTITKVSWSGDVKPGDGNPYTYKPDKGTHGQKKGRVTVTYRYNGSGVTGSISKEFEFKLFFEKKGDDDGDNNPNWFEYWGPDGAVPGLVNPLIIFDPAKGAGSYGAWSPASDKVELGAAAAETHYPGGLTIAGTTYGNVKGVDSVSEVIFHELRHRTTIKVNWGAGGAWVGKTDSDFHVPTNAYYDNLPDEYETAFGTDKNKTDSKDLEHIKSPVYKYYGDNEYDAVVGGHNKKGVSEKDWANPGKQSDPVFAAAADADAAALGEVQSGEGSGPITEASRFETPAVVIPGLAQLSGSYSSAGVSLGGDAAFEVLRVNVGVNVTTPAQYHVVGWLQTAGGTDLAWAYTTANLAAGAQQVQLNFDGKLLRLANQNGPYKLAHVELLIGDEGDVVDFADNAHTTATFAATDFAPPAVTFTGAYADSGVDTNSNGLFDFLDVSVGVTVHQAGSYTLVGWLYDGSGNAIGGAGASVAFNASGTHTLRFDGRAIRWHRENGPYSLRYLEVRNAAHERVAFLPVADTTNAYTAAQFEGGGAAEMDAGAYTDEGVNVNGDSLFEYLRVHMAVDATAGGSYLLSAKLLDADGQLIVAQSKALSLTVGSNALTLDFPGGPIRLHGVDGPYRVAQVSLEQPDGTVVDKQGEAAATQAYTADSFSLALVALSGGFHDEAVDKDLNGQKDHLNVSATILPGSSGVVIAQGRLVDQNGEEIQWVESNVAVTAGVPVSVTLPFSAASILAHGVDGPWLVTNVLIYHTGDPGQAISGLPPYVTGGYRHTNLELFIGPPAQLTVTAAPSTVAADGQSTVTVRATVKDAQGNPVPNQAVNFTTTMGVIGASAQTGIDGVAAVPLSAATGGIAHVTATSGALQGATQVVFASAQRTTYLPLVDR